MSSLFQQTETQEVDNLKEYRQRRLQQVEGDIARHIAIVKQSLAAIEVSDAALADALYTVECDRLYTVDGYANMTEYARVRWPDLSKFQLSRNLIFGKINAQIDRYNQEQELHKSDFVQLPRLENQRQALAANAIPEDDRMPALGLASETADGAVPSARQISETYHALNGGSTHERIGRLDTSKPPREHNTQSGGETYVRGEADREAMPKRAFGYIDPDSVTDSPTYRRIYFDFVRPASQNYKGGTTRGLYLTYAMLIAKGWTPPAVLRESDEADEFDTDLLTAQDVEPFDFTADAPLEKTAPGKKALSPGVAELLAREDARVAALPGQARTEPEPAASFAPGDMSAYDVPIVTDTDSAVSGFLAGL